MRELQHYITAGTKRLRCGYTTGTCAAAAARAASELLLIGSMVPEVEVSTPSGINVLVEVEEHASGAGWARCAVRKDAGDDPDVTDGVIVYAQVSIAEEGDLPAPPAGESSSGTPAPPEAAPLYEAPASLLACGMPTGHSTALVRSAASSIYSDFPRTAENRALPGAEVCVQSASSGGAASGGASLSQVAGDSGLRIIIDGGMGVGRVTRAGLDQPPGAAAINRVPRQMIEEQVRAAAESAGFSGALCVEISIPEGVELATRTFNPKLGIEGGISVLGTGGIVRPMSEDAIVASIECQMSVLRARGDAHLLVSPGNYGYDFARDVLGLDVTDIVQCSNYIGATIDAAVRLGFESVLVVGHIGKLAKVAGGAMNTHSRVADGRLETLAAHAVLVGAGREVAARIMAARTTDEALSTIDAAGLLAPVGESVTQAAARNLAHRANGALRVDLVVFSNAFGELGRVEASS